ncbi:hypothetical protein ACL7TT_17105 [Microbulbifer sp. 2304DJ12-6]
MIVYKCYLPVMHKGMPNRVSSSGVGYWRTWRLWRSWSQKRGPNSG